ncbi:MAG: L-erythro-3,5-diaminohexanoate dehydrogenase [Polyangiaceae bacterium]|nr:L-erythro-3,5-diaminohexanoate dehydrogenase [Polyangiaceae bacterium]
MTSPGDPLGRHRVVPEGEPGAPVPLPQRAQKLDSDPEKHFDSEIEVQVETLNIDAASFRQMEEVSGGDPQKVGELVLETVRRRGKQHNPVTGSGGMLLGKVSRIGDLVEDRGVALGDRIATLASLSLTPLHLRAIRGVRPTSAQVDVEGTAFIFATAPFAKMPPDLSPRLALAALDVAGAAPQVARLAKAGDTVLILGAGGKSGILCAVEARRRVGPKGRVIGLESFAPFAQDLLALGICDAVIELDARDAVAVRDRVAELTEGDGADLTLSCVNVPGCEMAAICATKDRGKVYFFAMSTSFTACALGAEGIGADVDLYIGNGYCQDHAVHTLELLRSDERVRSIFSNRYG